MSDLGDITTGALMDLKFTTVNSLGVPTTLAGTPVVSVYKDNGTTQSTAGITLTVNFDAITGLNHVRVDTSADGTFYSAGSNFQAVITTGTVDGNSVIGYPVGSFSILNRSSLRPTVAGRTLNVESDGMAHADLKEWLGAVPSALISGRVDANMQAIADGVITAAKFAAGAFDAVWTVTVRSLTTFGTLVADIWAGVTQAFYAAFFTGDSGETFASAVDGSVVKEIAANSSGGGTVNANVIEIDGDSGTLARLKRVTDSEVLGTVGGGSSTTSIVTSSLAPAAVAADQFKGRIVLFDRATTTAELRGQGTRITASSAGGVLTVEALSTAPASGDTFTVV